MIALDTNVLVRFVVEDDAGQTARAARLIASAVEKGETLFVAKVVLCEIAWVLGSAYDFSRSDVRRALGALVQARQLDIEDKELVRQALDDYAVGKGDFADYLNRASAAKAGYDVVATFDKALIREAGFLRP